MNDKAKIIIAIVCLAGAGLAVAWQMGLFGSSKPQGAQSTVPVVENDYEDEDPEQPRIGDDSVLLPE
ncbi:MAG: hypothetical protein Tsb0013_20960 [Phycisphaerales bacterium]